ncbi:MAG TPA: PhzF family phenazine biosynthesis protein [Rugosimonospora sp.]|nr:PhzF family phenazine biosynthesis protein [Rugosimonospora sp.]
MQSLPYEVVDVFTDRPFTGNPLAVVFDAESLSVDQFQAIAREFRLPETVFVLKPAVSDATYRARIFTPETELPFAGHPSVGAAVTYCRREGLPPGELVQECGAGLLPIQVYEGGKARLTGGTPTVGPELDPAPLLRCVGLTVDDFAGPAPRVAGCGLEFPYLPVHADAVGRAAGDPTVARAEGVTQISVLHWDAVTATAHARVFCPGLGVPEDPATGSAALGLGVWLVTSGLLGGSGDFAYQVRQGAELHRPSTLDCTVTAAGGRAVSATVAGHVVPVASGRISVPPFVG